jgi:uncharacterized membrane protein YjjP (DUF1212 family)
MEGKMKKKKQKKILVLAVRAGEIMMKSGAEIYRVEDTVERICRTCGIDSVDVFATPAGIFVTMDRVSDSDKTYTYIRRIKGSETDLSKISRVNKFSREFTTTDMTVEEGMRILNEIEKERSYPFFVRLIAAAIVASCFSNLFGGAAQDFLVAFIAGMMAYSLSIVLQKYEINFFIRGMCCCALAAFCALVADASIASVSYAPVVMGCLMLFVPGVAITNSIRDFLSGDMLSGLARMTEAILTAISLACGSGIIIKLWDMIGGVTI